MTNQQHQAGDYEGWIGREAVDAQGDKIGKISQLFLDDHTGQPEWVTVNTGLFKSRSSFVPLRGATASGEALQLAFPKDRVKDAPQVDDDGDGHLTPEEEAELYRYYGLGEAAETPTEAPAGDGHQGRDTSGPTTDEAMTRSEEELRVGKTAHEAGRVRLRKHVVTEQVTQTVPISHEEVRVEREPITDSNVGAATDGPDISEEEHEVVVHEERPVIAKEVVPKERVRLGTETVTEEVPVSEQVRKEHIEQEGAESQGGAGGA
jgi:uncharacterized protein (TIGR02271 family)